MTLCKLCDRPATDSGYCWQHLARYYDESEPPTPAESPNAKRTPSVWARVSGAPRKTLRPREVVGLSSAGAMLAVATGAADTSKPAAVALLALAWLAFAGALWLSRRL